jgi:hypothetical protein
MTLVDDVKTEKVVIAYQILRIGVLCVSEYANNVNTSMARLRNMKCANKMLSMKDAPEDRPILAYCRHDYKETEFEGTMTPYEYYCEGLHHVEDGWNVICWVDDWDDGDFETGPSPQPGWWALTYGDGEIIANPIGWVELPEYEDGHEYNI